MLSVLPLEAIALLLCTVGSLSTAAAASPSSSPTFIDQSSPLLPLDLHHSALHSAAKPTSPSSSVVRYTWPSREAQEEAFARFSHLDVWRRTPTTFDVRQASGPDSPDSFLVEEDLVRGAGQETVIPSVEALLEVPSISTVSNLAHSHAALANFTSMAPEERKRATAKKDPIHLSYHPYDNIVTILETFVHDFPSYAKLVSFGDSSEGREIWGIQVSNFSHALPGELAGVETEEVGEEYRGKGKGGKRKKGLQKKLGVFVGGTQHAREWVTASTSLYFVHELLLSTLPDATTVESLDLNDLLKYTTFTVVPVINVDGYAYTWTNDRLWRKNRQQVKPSSECVGIDLNRNWGYKYAAGTRPNPCSESYPGTEAFQAPELKAISTFLSDRKNNIRSFVDLHSFGQLLMFPYSFSCSKKSPDAEDHFEAVVGAAKALRSVHGRAFETGSVCDVSLSGPGDAIDWAYGGAKITWSFTLELRDNGVHGFLLPANQILPSGEETTAALASLTSFVVGKESGSKKVRGD